MKKRLIVENYNGFIDKITDETIATNKISPELYWRYNVKRGLRNEDGTGVLVGLTEIGDVHGYIMDENEKVPVHGRLRYRGIDVEEIISGILEEDRFGFEEVCYLILFGKLPGKKELETFTELLGSQRRLPDGFLEDVILAFPSKDLMNMLARYVLAMYSFDDDPDNLDVKNNIVQSILLIAMFPSFVSYGYQAKEYNYNNKTLHIRNPLPELSSAENILRLIRSDGQYTREEAKILDLFLILHAEHGGGNNSAFATHVVSSSGTDIYSAIVAAIGSLKGPRHGGANIKVMGMMDEIKANVKNWDDENEVADYLKKILQKKAYDRTGLIYGIGHAVYTLSDPRAVILKEQAKYLAEKTGRTDEFKLYDMIERISPALFNEHKGLNKAISANVDFYSGFLLDMLGIPKDMYTPLFAVSRIVGWCGHRIEELINGGKIMRPAYKNVVTPKKYTKLSERD
ncbi:MAG: citrate/2-methylcitrate synthase [Clostridia bacterium]|jgi:citrate synthase|nr:citrate/2-methylcitrate synthase [Clostridiaceae bacterium]